MPRKLRRLSAAVYAQPAEDGSDLVNTRRWRSPTHDATFTVRPRVEVEEFRGGEEEDAVNQQIAACLVLDDVGIGRIAPRAQAEGRIAMCVERQRFGAPGGVKPYRQMPSGVGFATNEKASNAS